MPRASHHPFCKVRTIPSQGDIPMLPVTSQQTLPGQLGGECEPQSCKWCLGRALQGWETNCAWKQKAGLVEEPETSSKM